MARTRIPQGVLLLVIVGVVVLAILLAPAESDTGGASSSYSAGQTGVRLAFDVARHLGWPAERRDVPLKVGDSAAASIQVLIGAPVGAQETHALLDHVRRGGSLLVAGLGEALSDSLGATGGDERLVMRNDDGCPAIDPFASIMSGGRTISPIRWRRPPPRDTVGFGHLMGNGGKDRPAVGFPLGAGRVVIVADPEFLSNDLMRDCPTGVDVAYVGMLDYLSHETPGTRVAFDEFHHGKGQHGGSLSAIRTYVVETPSGRMLGQIAIAGLLLLFAAAPRPLSPRDPARIARRNPIEHAEALARAYAAVGATRTATVRLLAGVRRRVRRGRSARESDEQLLAVATSASPSAASAASIVSHALAASVPPRDLSTVADALSTIESALTSRPSSRKS